MPSTSSLLNKLRADYPHFQFIAGREFRWSPDEQTIFYDDSTDDPASLLHELAHATLGHQGYTRDIELIEMEQSAWQHATATLASRYRIVVSEDIVESSLDTYRDWLHARSTCPNCNATGLQTRKSIYACMACRTQWHVNDARICALRRHTIGHTKTHP